jgi:hypothetical protein
MSDQVTNKSAVPEESQVRVLEMALPSAASSSDMLLRRIVTLLLILVAGVLTVFGYYASSICITALLTDFSRSCSTRWWSHWRNCIYRAVWPRRALCSRAWV